MSHGKVIKKNIMTIYTDKEYDMSRFSGKYDFYDYLSLRNYTVEEFNNKCSVYIGNSENPLKINSISELIPYYPYIIVVGSFDNTNRKTKIRLSFESYIDYFEKDFLKLFLKDITKEYKKRMKLNQPFEFYVPVFGEGNEEACYEIIKRLKNSRRKPSLEGIHLKHQEYYRQELVNEMLKNNINPADYGYERFMEEKND